jgi:hypothetical protein
MKEYTTLIEPRNAREHKILTLIDEGLSYNEIGQALHIEKATVTWYVQQIYDKLGLEKSQRNHRSALSCARALDLLAGFPKAIPPDSLEPHIKDPYKGLRPFQQVDTRDFFSGDALIQRFLTRLDETRAVSHFLVISRSQRATGIELSCFEIPIATNAWAAFPPDGDHRLHRQNSREWIVRNRCLGEWTDEEREIYRIESQRVATNERQLTKA